MVPVLALALLPLIRPVSVDTRVNTSTTGDQHRASIASFPGGFVVSWVNGEAHTVERRLVSGDGAPYAGPFLVSTTTASVADEIDVVSPVLGSQVVAWLSTSRQVYATRPGLGTLRVDTGASAENPTVAAAPTGEFVVVWSRVDLTSILARRVSARGELLGAELRVNGSTSGTRTGVSVATDIGGRFVVAWAENNVVVFRRFDRDGVPLGAQVTVGGGSPGGIDVATADDGSFLVVWSDVQTVRARGFDREGEALADFTAVSEAPSSRRPRAASLADGTFVVVWDAYTPERDILMRRVSAEGVGIGAALRVNASTTGSQARPALARGGDRLLVVWESESASDLDGDGSAVHVRAFDVGTVRGDSNADASVNVGDVLYLINFLFAGGPAPVR